MRHGGGMQGIVAWAERYQVPLYLLAILVGAGLGLVVPGGAGILGVAITPLLALLLYATFLGVPFGRVRRALADRRFLVTVLVVNFVAVPLVVWALSRFVAADIALLTGVLLVLLTPCVDYVIVFAGLAGGDRERLLAATPLLMIVQLVLLPGYLWLMAGPELVEAVEILPFVEAFLVLIVLPLALAALTQFAARRSVWAQRVRDILLDAMVPLMMATLFVVVASQVHAVAGALGSLLAVVPVFVAFAVIAAVLGAGAGRIARLDVPAWRSVVFSGVTRNSLVVLPLALALPPAYALAPLVVVTQTLVELLAMVAMIALVPRWVRPPRR